MGTAEGCLGCCWVQTLEDTVLLAWPEGEKNLRVKHQADLKRFPVDQFNASKIGLLQD